MARVLRYLIFTSIGGFVGWAIVEPINALTPPGNPPLSLGAQFVLGMLIGMFIGAGVGVASALSGVSPRDAVKSVVIGVGVGAAAGALGFMFGNRIYAPLHYAAQGTSTVPSAPLSFAGFLLELIGRSIGWAIMGAFIGLSQGLATESTKKMINGLIGGFIGGGAGGFAFQIFHVFGVPSFMLRMIGFTITGAAIGMFIGFIEELTKRASLIHLKGRNEGREFQVFKRETYVGRDELVDVPAFGDPDIEPRHFVIRADEQRHRLEDLGTVAGTMVNSQKVTQPVVLKDGDIIQVGMTKFQFRDRATRSFVSSTSSAHTGGPQIPTSEHVCQFCGSIKDPQGNCACSVGSAPSQGTTVVQQDPFTTATHQPTMPVAAPSGGQPRLLGISGPYAGQSFALSPQGELRIGRQPDRNMALSADNTVSREHARIVNENGSFVIYDMGSANGTHVNNTRISRQALTNGDIVQIGGTKFRVDL